MLQNSNWTKIIDSKSNKINLKDIFYYKELVYRFVYRDFITLYKQTILGPVWYFIQPIIMMLAYMLVFNNIAKISTDAVPPSLFYLSGIILWNYFSETFTNTADTFNQNQNIFGKVYFPRLVIPLSKLISGLIKFIIQFLLFLIFYFYFTTKGYEFNVSQNIYLFPFLVIMVGLIGLGLGLIFTSLTVRYRDLKFLLQFGIQILMFCTPIIYPMSSISKSSDGSLIRNFMFYNPMSHIIECFRYLFLGKGEITFEGLIYSFAFSLLIVVIGVYIFRRSEKTFIDNI